MINFDSVANASEDFWYDYEFEVIQRQVEAIPPGQWGEFQDQCLRLPIQSQERMANILGDIDTVESAGLLLHFCKSPDRGVVLTAREAARSLSLDVVKRAASDLSPPISGRTINDILEAVAASALGHASS